MRKRRYLPIKTIEGHTDQIIKPIVKIIKEKPYKNEKVEEKLKPETERFANPVHTQKETNQQTIGGYLFHSFINQKQVFDLHDLKQKQKVQTRSELE